MCTKYYWESVTSHIYIYLSITMATSQLDS